MRFGDRTINKQPCLLPSLPLPYPFRCWPGRGRVGRCAAAAAATAARVDKSTPPGRTTDSRGREVREEAGLRIRFGRGPAGGRARGAAAGRRRGRRRRASAAMAPAAAAGSAAGGGRGEGIEGADGGGGDGRPRARGQRAGEDDRGPVPSRERGHPHGARGRARKRAQQPPPLDGAPDSDREAPAPATLGLTASAGLLAVGLVARALARRRTRRRAAAAAAAERAAAAQAAAVARREAEQRAAARAVALAELEAKFEPLPNCKLVPRAELARPWSPVGGGSFGSVFSTSWLGQPVVAKRLKRVRDLADVDALVAEAAVLGAIGPHPCIGLYYGAAHPSGIACAPTSR
eukprot:PRCOL_00000689-RA